MTDILDVKSISRRLAGIRRDIHSYPELGFQEKRTGRKIAGLLKGIGLSQVRSPVADTGVVGLLLGGKGRGKTVALRADMDALPIQEENNIPYKSRNAGVMHACGHDAHIAMCLGAAMILKRLQGEIKGQVKFIFQPAEEGLCGAEGMITAGALKKPDVDVIFALHVDPEVDLGAVACAPGPVWAAADSFEIEITGRGGHGAFHYKCVDPIMVANQIYAGLQSIERNLQGTDARVISVCSVHGGSAFNIIPERVAMKGTVRTFDKRVQATIIKRMREIVAGISAAHGAKAKINYQKLQPAVINDSRASALLCCAAKDAGLKTIPSIPRMGGEDFAFYLQYAPGVMATIGIRTRKDCPGWHNNRFDVDDRVLPFGAALLAKCALLGLE
ncbi:MAG: M20 family metallopeptidase [Kiritimatiellia bacterium]|nr:M20 family metallopeptidase [Kiritimatiellia bacterium]